MKNRINFQPGLVLLLVLLTFASCAKHTTPKKVDKHLTEGTWKIGQAKVGGSTITSAYTGVKFKFSSQGTIYVTGEMTTQGSWSLGGEKNPVLMFMSFPQTATALYQFSDDWYVMEMSKTECVVKRNDASAQDDQLVFRRID